MQQTSLESIWGVLKYLTNAIVVPRDCYLSPNLPPVLSQQQVIFLKMILNNLIFLLDESKVKVFED